MNKFAIMKRVFALLPLLTDDSFGYRMLLNFFVENFAPMESESEYELILLESLSENDRRKAGEYIRSRNLYNKYTQDELLDWINVDLYEALGLDSYRYAEIPKSILAFTIQKQLIAYHPSRNKGKNEAFVIIKKAEEIFSNKRNRKMYDSVVFDEDIPEDRGYTPEEYLRAFAPVFERNGYFSEAQPVPKLQDSVDEFYRFWGGFKTTRMYDRPEDYFGQSKSSQKYYAEQNKEAIQRAKCADLQRIQRLVKLAYKHDHRIVRKEPVNRWKDEEVKSMCKFSMLAGKSKDKYNEIAKKLNSLYLTKRSGSEVKDKLESLGKK